MTRRGVIAALLAFFSLQAKGQEREPSTAFEVEVPEDQFGINRNCKKVPNTDNLVYCDPEPPYQYALTVKYKTRVVRFTADELMDILEGKPRD